MSMSGYYPAGCENDPFAPWNRTDDYLEEEEHEEEEEEEYEDDLRDYYREKEFDKEHYA